MRLENRTWNTTDKDVGLQFSREPKQYAEYHLSIYIGIIFDIVSKDASLDKLEISNKKQICNVKFSCLAAEWMHFGEKNSAFAKTSEMANLLRQGGAPCETRRVSAKPRKR